MVNSGDLRGAFGEATGAPGGAAITGTVHAGIVSARRAAEAISRIEIVYLGFFILLQSFHGLDGGSVDSNHKFTGVARPAYLRGRARIHLEMLPFPAQDSFI